jgi:DNA-binding transcriptional LysR family regulator
MSRRVVPAWAGLRAFEAAMRLGSFAAAAAELGVTPGAVSQSVRGLEDRIGVALFTRRPQSLVPTRAARDLLPVLTEAFDAVDAAIRRIQAPAAAAATPLRVAAPAGFAAGWLVGRLDRFQQRAPDIALTVTATERLIEPGEGPEAEAIDACIRFGRAGWSGRLACDFLFADRRLPVCSPKYALAHPLVPGGADPLAGHTLLETLTAPADWSDWAVFSGAPLAGTRRLSFGDERLAMEAAAGGLGIALCDRALVAEAMIAGRLVAPLEPLEMVRGTAWFLVYPAAAAGAETIAAFRRWLLEECGGSLP